MLCKMFCRLAVLGAVVLSASAWGDNAALAQSKKLTTKKPTAREELLKKYDTNGNGKLDPKEINAMKDAQAKEAAAQNAAPSSAGAQTPGAGMPGRRPGGFGPGGFGGPGGPGGADFEARRAEFEKRFDTNGDGMLDAQERAAMEEARKQFIGGPGAPGPFSGPEGEARRAEFMKKFDTNGDGQLDDAERAAMQKQFGQGGPGGFPGKRPGGINPNNKN